MIGPAGALQYLNRLFSSKRRGRSSWQLRDQTICLVALLWVGLGMTCALLADDQVEAIPPQLKAARDNALKWWRDSDNHITAVESSYTGSDGPIRMVVFILRDTNGRSLAVGRAGSVELQTFFQQRLQQRLELAALEYGLEEAQLEKLKLAADLDIGRFNRRVQEAEQYLNNPASRDEARSSKRYLSSISRDCDGGLFRNESLFGRVLATLLATK